MWNTLLTDAAGQLIREINVHGTALNVQAGNPDEPHGKMDDEYDLMGNLTDTTKRIKT